MKENVLRRLGALVLILALTLSLTVTPARAATGVVDGKNVTLTLDPGSAPKHPTEANALMLTAGSTDANTAAITAKVEGLTDFNVHWESSQEDVVRVDYDWDNSTTATLTALKPGTDAVTITASLQDPDGNELKDASGNPVVIQETIRVYSFQLSMWLFRGNTRVEGTTLAPNPAIGDEITLEATVRQGNDIMQDPSVVWTVTDESGTDVISPKTHTGKDFSFEIKNPGTAAITATSAYGPTATCRVYVPDPDVIPVTGVTVSPKTLIIEVGGRDKLTATVSPPEPTDPTIRWSSSADDVVEVDPDGNIQAIKTGKATITATSVSNPLQSDTCEIEVVSSLLGFTFLNTSSGKFDLNANLSKPGEQQSIEAVKNPSDAYLTYNSVTWASSNTGVATVTKDSRYTTGAKAGLVGILTIVGPGRTEISIESGSVRGVCTVEVPGLVLKSGVLTMTNGKLSMKEGDTEQLTYDAYGRVASEIGTTAPVWFSSDSSIVDVDRNTGKLTARKPGTVTITLTLGNYEAKCTVTVAEDTSTLITVTERVSASVPMSLYSARTSWGTIYSEMNRIASEKLGGALSYINNISVATEQGIVHNNHRSEADTGAGVGIMEQYKPSGTGPDTLSALSFVPRSTYSGIAEITFTGWGNGKSFNGTIRVTVAGLGEGGDVSYSTNGNPVTFLSDDFNTVSNSKAGHNLKYITFTPPAASTGTLYYNYTSESHPGEKVAATTQYRRSGTPSLDKVTFVPAKGYSGTVSINYRAVDSSDVAYTGTVTIKVTAQYDPAGPGDIYYNTGYGSWATFRAVDFANASLRATGETLSYVRFRQPLSSEGTLFYNYSGFASNGGVVSPETSYYSSGTPLLSSVSFVPTTTSPSQVEVPYTGYSIRGTAFTGTVYVTVVGKPVQAEESGTWYTTIVGRSLWLKGSDFYRACQEATGKTLYYVQFTSLPSVGTGTLRYASKNGASSSTVSADTWCYYDRPNSGVQLDNVYFQPGTSFTGTVRLPYRGYCTDRTAFDGEVVIQVSANASTAVSNYFYDMRTYSWAASAVDYLYEKGVVNGVEEGIFEPGQQVLRRDFVVMLCRAFHFDSDSTDSFPDVPANAYFSRSIAAAKELGVVSGNGTNFMPDGKLTRQDAMVMIKNAMDAAGWRVVTASTSVLNRFPDRGSVADYAQSAVGTLVQMGAVSGDGNGRLNPGSTITRAEVAVILHDIMTM